MIFYKCRYITEIKGKGVFSNATHQEACYMNKYISRYKNGDRLF